MTWPPSVLSLRVGRFRIWIPLILIWPLMLLVWLLFTPLLVALAIVTLRLGYVRPLLLTGPAVLTLFAALRGLEIDVRSSTGRGYVAFK